MCDFCNNIKDVEYIRKHPSWERVTEIAQTEENTFGLWVECEDYYYSGIAMKINFCPTCGANLAQEALLKKERANNPYYQKYGFDF